MTATIGLRGHESLPGEITGSIDLSGLTPILRVLLVTDGTVTRTLEAYFNEAIDVDVLEHAERNSEHAYPQIEIAAGDPILHRFVTLRGRTTRRVYAAAESVAVLDHISQQIRRKLIEERKGIGELLREGRLETYRELLTARHVAAGAWAEHLGVATDEQVVTRDYRIFQGGRAALLIQEAFPQLLFAQRQ
jgi:chorismate-pyruvate lyase